MRLLIYKMKVIFEEPPFQVDSFYLFLAKNPIQVPKLGAFGCFLSCHQLHIPK